MLFLLLFAPTLALCDPLLESIKISTRAAQLQAARLAVASENLSSASVLPLKLGQSPYRRKLVSVKNRFDLKTKLPNMRFTIKQDFKTPFKLRYEPDHPGANASGYVQCANVEKEIELADVAEARIGYDLNVRLIKLFAEMSKASIGSIR